MVADQGKGTESMPFVTRDGDGRLIAIAEYPLDDDPEELPPDDPEVVAFIERTCEGGGGPDDDDRPFVSADLSFIRVVEDLIEVLMRKGVISLADLPPAAQEKLMSRRAMRHWLAGVAGIVDDGGDGNII
jgi:hypothetical protein